MVNLLARPVGFARRWLALALTQVAAGAPPARAAGGFYSAYAFGDWGGPGYSDRYGPANVVPTVSGFAHGPADYMEYVPFSQNAKWPYSAVVELHLQDKYGGNLAAPAS